MGKRRMDVQIKVLIQKSNYKGAYDSFSEFYKNIANIFFNIGADVLLSEGIDEAIGLLKNTDIDFTINVGQYPYYYNGKPLYDIFETVNYQWVIDNPIRYPMCDMSSGYNRMIYIDNNFGKYPGCGRTDYLCSSLPYPEYRNEEKEYNNDAILAPVKVKDIESFEQRIEKSVDRDTLREFIQEYDYDKSFNMLMIRYMNYKRILNLTEFFEIVNGYIRAQKRIMMLRAIKKHDVYVLSECPKTISFNDNIKFLGAKTYNEYLKLQDHFKIVLNSTPNYDLCVHDRIASGIMNGKIVISDENEMLSYMRMPMCFRYSEVNRLDEYLDDSMRDFKSVHNNQKNCLMNECVPSAESIVENYFNFKK